MVLRGNRMDRTYKAMGALTATVAVLATGGNGGAADAGRRADVLVPDAPRLGVLAVEAPDRSALRERLPAIRVPDLEPDGLERARDVVVPPRPTLAVTPDAPDLTVLGEELPALRVPDLRPEGRL